MRRLWVACNKAELQDVHIDCRICRRCRSFRRDSEIKLNKRISWTDLEMRRREQHDPPVSRVSVVHVGPDVSGVGVVAGGDPCGRIDVSNSDRVIYPVTHVNLETLR